MTPKQVIRFFGGIPNTAYALGVALPSVYDWLDANEVPELRQYQVELATEGKLRSKVPALRQARTK